MTSKTEYILSGLRRRGMPDHIARGFVMNFQDESGLDSGIEERVPNVHGTKGFGLAQWTGPRRDALVSYAASQGKPVGDPDMQMDYLMSELEGAEVGAWSKIKNAQTSGEAGAAIVNLFLRPAEQHRAERESRYLRDNDVAIQFSGFTDADGQENAAVDYATAYEAPKDVSPPTYLEEKSQEVQPYGSWLEEIGASYRSNAMTAAVVRSWSEGTIDPTFEIGQDRAAELSKHVPDHYLDFILTSGSEQVLRSRQEWMMADIERQQRLAAGGWSAAGAGLVAGVIDPISLVAGIATGGLGSAAVAARAGMAGRVATGAAFGAAENASLEAVSGEVFDNPNADPAMAAAFGAAFGSLGGALSRGPGGHAHPEAQKAFRLAGDANSGKMRVHPDPILTADAPNLSAAGNTEQMKPLMVETRAYDTEVSDKDAATGFGGKARFDVVGQMTTSDQPLVRVLGAHLGEETAGFTDHSVVPDSAASRATAYHRKFLGNYVSVAREAEEEYIREVAGIRNGAFTPFKAAKAREEFNREVFEWVTDHNPSPDTHPAVVKAGIAFRNGMAGWRDEIERSGLAALNKDPHYVPMVSDASKIAELDVRFSEEAMHDLIAHAIRAHSPTLSPEVVARMSKGYWRNIRRAAWGMENDIDRAIGTGDREAFKNALLQSLDSNEKLTPEQVDAAFDAVTGAMDGTGKDPNAASSRGIKALKKRTLMDYSFGATVRAKNGEMVQLRITDFFRKDAGDLFAQYSRSMSGRVALAETRIENPSKPGYWITDGIKSEADVAKLKEAIKEEARQMGKAPGDNAVENQIENLEFMYKRVAGIAYWDNSGSMAQLARRIKSMQFIRLMSNMGLNQIQESWKIFTLTGYRAVYDQMPGIANLIRGIRSGEYQSKALIDELQDMTGIGVEGMFSSRSLRFDDARIGESPSGKIGRKIDGALDYMSEVTANISFMRHIHEWQSNKASALIVQQMANMAKSIRNEAGDFDFSKIAKGDQDRLKTMGLGAKDAELLFRNLLDNASFDGRRVSQINHQAWDPEAVSKFRVFVGRYVDRLVQANDPGGLAKWMSRPVAGMWVQFRSFVMGAWHKSTLWALNHGAFSDPRMMVLLAGEVFFGAVTYAIRMSPEIAKEDGWESYKAKLLNPTGLFANGFARSASASLVPALIDTSLVWGARREPIFAQARSSGTPTDAFVGMPVLDQIKSASAFTSGSLEAAFTDKPFTQSTAKAGVRAFAPFGNWLPIAAGFSSLTKGLPER